MMWKPVLLSLALHVAVCASTNLCSASYDSYQQVCGEATGNFQLLGSLCFAGGNGAAGKSNVTFQLTFSEATLSLVELSDYTVLFFDDQDDSFAALNRMMANGQFQNCSTRKSYSKGTWHVTVFPSKVTAGDLTTYTKTITITEHYSREWYFVLSACDNTQPVKLHSYTISSNTAVDCSTIYTSNDSGYIAAVVILVLVCVVLAVVSFIFYKRTKIPELLSMVRSLVWSRAVMCCTCGLAAGRNTRSRASSSCLAVLAKTAHASLAHCNTAVTTPASLCPANATRTVCCVGRHRIQRIVIVHPWPIRWESLAALPRSIRGQHVCVNARPALASFLHRQRRLTDYQHCTPEKLLR